MNLATETPLTHANILLRSLRFVRKLFHKRLVYYLVTFMDSHRRRKIKLEINMIILVETTKVPECGYIIYTKQIIHEIMKINHYR